MSALDDGDFTIEKAWGAKRITFPFDGDSTSFYTEQDFTQDLSSFAALPLNTQDPDDPLSFLVAESPLQDMGGNVVRWTRTFARVPESRNEFETFAYTFPGYWATLTSKFVTPWGVELTAAFPILDKPGRAPQTRAVTSRMRHEFFLCGAGPGTSYATPQLIPVIASQRYVYGSAWAATSGDDLPDKLLYPASSANYSVPTIEAWRALIAAGTEIVAEDSRISRWRGNIYMRVTRYLKAQ